MLEQSLTKAIRRANVEHEARALTQLTLGVLFTLLIFGGLFVIAALAMPWPWFAPKARLIAGSIVAVLLIVACWSAWARADPLQDIPRPGGTVVTDPPVVLPSRRHTAGLASLLMSGPDNVVESVASWRSRIRIDRPLLYAAADTLARAADGIDVETITDPAPTTLLRRLRLVKLQHVPDALGRIVLTERGRTLLAGAGRVSL